MFQSSFHSKTQRQTILLVSRRHVGAQSDVHKHGVSIADLSPFIFQILDFIYFLLLMT